MFKLAVKVNAEQTPQSLRDQAVVQDCRVDGIPQTSAFVENTLRKLARLARVWKSLVGAQVMASALYC